MRQARAWDITVTDTYAESHVDQTAREACSAANKAAVNKSVKYGTLSASHIFLPVVVDTAGTWNQSVIELIQEIGRCITAVTEDTWCSCSSSYLLLFKWRIRSPSSLHSTPCDTPSWSLFLLSLIFMPAVLRWWV